MSYEAELKDLLLKRLIQNFFMGNLNFYFKPEDVEHMVWDWQQAFLDATISSNLVKKYPISGQFTTLFLKKIIQYLEPYQEVHDDFYTHLCTAMHQSNKDGFSYRHYVLGNDINNIVTIKETRNVVVNGTTGLKTWEASLVLSDWALCNKHKFSNKHVLELGSGVGFTGITIGKHCNVKSLMFTDCHNDVLKTICENIEINFSHLLQEKITDCTMFKDGKITLEPEEGGEELCERAHLALDLSENEFLENSIPVSKEIVFKSLNCTLPQTDSGGVLMLDWNAIDDLPESMIPDILIGADIVYDPTILQPLCNVIQTLFRRNKHLEVYITSIIRNEETFTSFLKTLGDTKLDYEKIELSNSVFIEWDESTHPCLLKIKEKL